MAFWMSQSQYSGDSTASGHAELANSGLEAAVFWGGKGLLCDPTLMKVYIHLEKQSAWELMSASLLALTQTERWRGRSGHPRGGALPGL